MRVRFLPVNDYSGTIQVEADGADKSKVTSDAAFDRGYMNNHPPPDLKLMMLWSGRPSRR